MDNPDLVAVRRKNKHAIVFFTAMGAATVVPDPTILFDGSGIDRNEMALAVVAVAIIKARQNTNSDGFTEPEASRCCGAHLGGAMDIQVPLELQVVLREFTKTVLRERPEDVLEFSREYFVEKAAQSRMCE